MKLISSIFLTLLLAEGYLSHDVTGDDKFLVKVMHDIGYSGNSWVLSPASIRSVLEQLYIGSSGKTKQSLKSSLGITNDYDIFNEQTKLSDNPGEGVTWKTANKMIVRDTFTLKPSYQSKLSSIFHTDVVTDDFQHPQDLADSVNSWVTQHTDGYIKKLVNADSISETTMLVLNAVFFKGTWKYAFDEKQTAMKCFKSKSSDGCQQTNMMKQRRHFSYNQDDDLGAQIIQLPYNNTNDKVSYSMVIVLPTNQDGLESVVNKFSKNKLLDMIKSLDDEEVILTMPKFTTKFDINLNEPLKKMGLKTIFSENADFSKVSNVTGLYVGEVVQKAFIDVEEKGTIAAAATGSHMHWAMPMMPPPVFEFTADHPFLYFIMMNDEILFAGQYSG